MAPSGHCKRVWMRSLGLVRRAGGDVVFERTRFKLIPELDEVEDAKEAAEAEFGVITASKNPVVGSCSFTWWSWWREKAVGVVEVDKGGPAPPPAVRPELSLPPLARCVVSDFVLRWPRSPAVLDMPCMVFRSKESL